MDKNYQYKKSTIVCAITALFIFGGEYYLTAILEPYLVVSVISIGAVLFSIVSLMNAFAWRNDGYKFINLDKMSILLLASIVLFVVALLFLIGLFIYYGDGFI